jgi:hypothetical protein
MIGFLIAPEGPVVPLSTGVDGHAVLPTTITSPAGSPRSSELRLPEAEFPAADPRWTFAG